MNVFQPAAEFFHFFDRIITRKVAPVSIENKRNFGTFACQNVNYPFPAYFFKFESMVMISKFHSFRAQLFPDGVYAVNKRFQSFFASERGGHHTKSHGVSAQFLVFSDHVVGVFGNAFPRGMRQRNNESVIRGEGSERFKIDLDFQAAELHRAPALLSNRTENAF